MPSSRAALSDSIGEKRTLRPPHRRVAIGDFARARDKSLRQRSERTVLDRVLFGSNAVSCFVLAHFVPKGGPASTEVQKYCQKLYDISSDCVRQGHGHEPSPGGLCAGHLAELAGGARRTRESDRHAVASH
jgi:hypothetical protein